MIVAANEVVQDPDVVGTALKTAALRLTSSAGQLQELGEDAEGAAESVTKLQTQLLNLTKGRVNIMQDGDNTSFKSTYQIMKSMSEVWDDMTQKDKLQALELMFGKRAANVGASIIDNMTTAEKALNSSMDSAGSAMKENEKYLDSIQGRMNQFGASFQALSNTIVSSDLIKGLVSGGTGVVEGLDSIFTFFNSGVGKVIKDITLLTAAIAGLKAVASLDIFKNLLNVGGLKMMSPMCLVYRSVSERVYNENGITNKTVFK